MKTPIYQEMTQGLCMHSYSSTLGLLRIERTYNAALSKVMSSNKTFDTSPVVLACIIIVRHRNVRTSA